MPTVKEVSERCGKSGVVLDQAVLVEASGPETVLPSEGSSKFRWHTRTIKVEDITQLVEGTAGSEERLLALMELVSDDSEVFELVKSGDNESPNVCIGRAKRNDIVIEDDTISSLHAIVEVTSNFDEGERHTLVDQGSSNGTWVNQEKLEANKEWPLRGGDCVRLGQRVFYYLTSDEANLAFSRPVQQHKAR